MTTIYYIRDDSDLEFNRDLFVCSNTTDEALSLWRDNYKMDSDDEPVSIYELPIPSLNPRVLDWNDLDGVMLVWKSKKIHSAI